MKSLTTAVLAILAVSFVHLSAQEENRKVRFLLYGEPHINWLYSDEPHLETGTVRMGVDAGMRLDLNFDRYYAFSFGAGIHQTGGKIGFTDTLYLDRITGFDTLVPGTQITYRLQYVEIPLAVKFKTPQIGYTTLFAEVGLDPMISTRALIDATDNSIIKESFQQGVYGFNLAYHTGIGLVYELRNGMGLQFQLVYQNTFLDVTREGNIRQPDNTRLNQAGLSIGIIF